MTYRFSSSNIQLTEQGKVLTARCIDAQGAWHDSSLPLDLLVGNTDGNFDWTTTGFSTAARYIRIADNGATLQAELPDRNGRRRTTTVGLNDYIVNIDGVLRASVPALFTFAPACTQKITENLSDWLDSWPYSVVKVAGESSSKVTTFFFSTSHEISVGMTQLEMLMSPHVFFLQAPTLALEQAIRRAIAAADKLIEPITNTLIPCAEKMHKMIGIEIGGLFAHLANGTPLDSSYCSVALDESVVETLSDLDLLPELEVNKDGYQYRDFATSLKLGGAMVDLTVLMDSGDVKIDVRRVADEVNMAARESAHEAEREFGIFIGGVESFLWRFW